eukprot:scaffold1319_cov126-Cylindrotheca_fusiformis.AAC.61
MMDKQKGTAVMNCLTVAACQSITVICKNDTVDSEIGFKRPLIQRWRQTPRLKNKFQPPSTGGSPSTSRQRGAQ